MPLGQCSSTRPTGRKVLSGARRWAEPGSARRERVAGQGSSILSRFPDALLSARMPGGQCPVTRPAGRRVLSSARRPAEPGSAGAGRRSGKRDGEGGIRTLDPPFGRYAISSRVPSAARTPLRSAMSVAASISRAEAGGSCPPSAGGASGVDLVVGDVRPEAGSHRGTGRDLIGSRPIACSRDLDEVPGAVDPTGESS